MILMARDTYEAPLCRAIKLAPESNMLQSGSTKDLGEYEDL